MFGSAILDVALGLVLVFLLVSLVLTAVQEVIESWLRSRAGDLNRAIYELLQQDPALLKQLHEHPLIFALHRAGLGSTAATDALAVPIGLRNLFGHGKAARAARALLPSYIPRETFAAALMDMLKNGDVPANQPAGARLIDSYRALNRVAGGDLERVRTEIQGWYDAAMDRASGWFKRRTQKILFWLGLAVALALNINAITIGNYLATSKSAQAAAAAYAEKLAGPDKPPPSIDALQGELQDSIGLPIGWSRPTMAMARTGFARLQWSRDWRWGSTLEGLFALLSLAAGYLITAFAATLGAPFWFDALNRIMVIRSTVKPREKSPDEPSADGGAAKPAVGGAAAPATAPLVALAAPKPAPLAPAAGEAELDGCLAEHELLAADVTRDEDLPPATGGVA